jgi:hypothetical protein
MDIPLEQFITQILQVFANSLLCNVLLKIWI